MPKRQTPPAPRYLDIDLRPYAGRYIALVEGHIVAVGATADDARARALAARPQRQPTVLYIAPIDEDAKDDGR